MKDLLARLPWPSRVARPASRVRNLAKTTLQAAVFGMVFLVVLPVLLHRVAILLGLDSPNPPPLALRFAGVALFAAATALNWVSAWVMAVEGDGTPLPIDATRRLVARGPYRYVRNPMAIAGILQGVAVGVFLGSPWVVGYALAGAVLWQVVVRPWEEADLQRRFGETYARYRAAVPCWLPQRTPYAVGPEGLEPPTSSV